MFSGCPSVVHPLTTRLFHVKRYLFTYSEWILMKLTINIYLRNYSIHILYTYDLDL